MSQHANPQLQSGFFAETAQTAVASYQPQLPQGESLQTYLSSLVAAATAAIGVPDTARRSG